MKILPLYYFAADLAKNRVERGDILLGCQTSQLFLARRPLGGKMMIRDLSRAPLLQEGGVAVLPGLVRQTRDALQEGEHLILLAETVFQAKDDSRALPAVLVWVCSQDTQILGVNPILSGSAGPSLDIRQPSNSPLAPGDADSLFPTSRVLH